MRTDNGDVTTQTLDPVQTPEDGNPGPPRSRRQPASHSDFAVLKPTLLVVGALLLAAGIAVGVTLIVWSPQSAGDIAVSETDYRISMPTKLTAGQHTLALTNNGKQGHEIVVFRTDLPANALPVDANGEVEEESPLLHNVGDSGNSLAPGGTKSVPVKLAPGHYVAVCNLPNHYHLGMKLDLTVTR